MCGIAGIAGIARDAQDRARVVGEMTDAIRHRGPDAEGYWHDESCALGHRRLSIIDLSPAGRQPMPNETGDVQLVFNGEIYAYEEVRQRLIAQGHTLRSR